MHLIIKDKDIIRLNKIVEWLMYMFGYILVFMLVSSAFKSIYVDLNHFYVYSTLIVLIIYILNQTIKPVLVTLTIPITGLTLGLFYPFINLFILKLTDWILGKHFDLKNIFIALLVAVLLSIMNFIVEEVIKTIIKKVKKHG